MDANRGRIDAGIDAKICNAEYVRSPGPRLACQRAGASGMARVPRAGSRRALSRAEDFNQLERSTAAATLEDPRGARLVIVCRGWSHAVHTGAAWSKGGGG